MTDHGVTIAIPDETHTLASALRPILEELNPYDLVTCTHTHPLNTFIQVQAPSVQRVREALLVLHDRIVKARSVVEQY